jgi:hypothetical protein
MNSNLGSTGEFPRGKVDEADEGELRMAIFDRDGTVFIDFGKKTAWIGLDAATARQMGALLIHHANAIDPA